MCRGLSTDDRTIQTTKYVEGSGFQGYDAMLPAKRHIIDDLNSQRICYVNLISRNKKYYFELSNSLPTYYSQAVYILTSSQIQWLSYASIKEIHNHSIRNKKKKGTRKFSTCLKQLRCTMSTILCLVSTLVDLHRCTQRQIFWWFFLLWFIPLCLLPWNTDAVRSSTQHFKVLIVLVHSNHYNKTSKTWMWVFNYAWWWTETCSALK